MQSVLILGRRSSYAALLCGALVGCGQEEARHQTQNPIVIEKRQHRGVLASLEAHFPVNDENSFWGKISFEDHWKIFSFYYSFFKGTSYHLRTYPQEHASSSYLQAWADHIDRVLRDRYSEFMVEIPQPRIMLIRSAIPIGGAAIGIPDCLRMKFILDDAQEESLDTYWDMSLGRIPEDMCFELNELSAETEEFIKDDIKGRFSSCSPTFVSGSEGVALDLRGCSLSSGIPAGFVVRYRQSNWVIVNGSVFSDSQRIRLLYILAHELAHYYLNHAQVPRRNYWIPYRLSERDWSSRSITVDEELEQFFRANFETFELIPVDGADSGRSLLPGDEELLREAEARDLGIYTPEDEADEFALEILSLIGISTIAAIEEKVSWHWPKHKLDISTEDCIRSYNNQWTADGVIQPPPVADYYGIHHSVCFSAFSMDQVQVNRQYDQLVLPDQVEDPQGSWEEFLLSLDADQ